MAVDRYAPVYCPRCNKSVRFTLRGRSVEWGEALLGCEAIGELDANGEPIKDGRDCPTLQAQIKRSRSIRFD